MIKKIFLIGLFLLLGTASVFASDDEFKVRITSVRYDRGTSEFYITYDQSADSAHLRHANNFSVVSSGSDTKCRVLWWEDPSTGAPPPESGFVSRTRRPRPQSGAYTDKPGNKWKKDTSDHGGEHWDVSFQRGGHINVMPPIPESPKWTIRGGRNALKRFPQDSKKKAEAILRKMNRSEGRAYTSRELAPIVATTGTGYLIYEDSKTLIAIAILPTDNGIIDSGLLLLIPRE